jgi:UDP-glucose 4-epimerase
MATKEVCAVTGASGCVGPALVRQLVAAGYGVRAFTRRSPIAGLLPPEAETYVGDVSDRVLIRRLTLGAKYVFHLAARLDEGASPPCSAEEYARVNVEGTRTVLNACRESGVQRLIYFSTINVYGSARGGLSGSVDAVQQDVVDEDTLTRPAGVYAETKRWAEQVVLETPGAVQGQTSATVLRFAAIYGPRMKGNYVRLVKRLRRRLFIPIGDGTNRRTLVHEEDAASAARLAAEHPLAAARIYNVSDGQIHSVHEILQAICAALGRNPPRAYLPFLAAVTMARSGDALLKLLGVAPRYAATVAKFAEDRAVRAERIREELGFEPNVDLCSGWTRTVAAWNLEGRIMGQALVGSS